MAEKGEVTSLRSSSGKWKGTVLVPSGCDNKILHTGCLQTTGYLFLTILEAGARMLVLAGERPLLGCRLAVMCSQGQGHEGSP